MVKKWKYLGISIGIEFMEINLQQFPVSTFMDIIRNGFPYPRILCIIDWFLKKFSFNDSQSFNILRINTMTETLHRVFPQKFRYINV